MLKRSLREHGYSPEITRNCAKVSAVGAGMSGVPGVTARIVEALVNENIQILQSADSHTTIWVLVRQDDMVKAVNALHRAFGTQHPFKRPADCQNKYEKRMLIARFKELIFMHFGNVSTAMVTPFDSKGNIDLTKTTKLVNYLIENGSDSLVVAGTTGESPTLSTEEKLALFRHVVKVVDKRVPVIAGTGKEQHKSFHRFNKKGGRNRRRRDHDRCSVL